LASKKAQQLVLVGGVEAPKKYESSSMKTVRQLLYKETCVSIAFVAMGFLALFFFFDLVDELSHIGKSFAGGTFGSYQIQHALLYVALLIPTHLYELLPITVLIGGVFVMARLAHSSEFTILRTSGLGPDLALRLMLILGLVLVVITFVIGDYIAPAADKTAQLLKARYLGQISVGQTGAWLKEKKDNKSYAVNVSAMSANADMLNVRLFEFDAAGSILSTTHAKEAVFESDKSWTLKNVRRSEYAIDGTVSSTTKDATKEHTLKNKQASIKQSQLETYRWPTNLNADMVTVALLKPDRMGTVDLFQYIRHLDANKQVAQLYEIQFWKKVFYPISCVVMLVLALPFAYLHFRSGGITAYVFGGVMVGISFFVLNNIFDYFGNLLAWNPLFTAAAPSMVYLLLSLVAFSALVFKR
jgi:lipopolysaccharide export system permease protein